MLDIRFKTRKLEKAFAQIAEGRKLWGDMVARRYIERVNALQTLDNAKLAAKEFPEYRPQELKGKRKGQWAMNLNDRWRLIYEPAEDGLTISIEEVTNHYGD